MRLQELLKDHASEHIHRGVSTNKAWSQTQQQIKKSFGLFIRPAGSQGLCFPEISDMLFWKPVIITWQHQPNTYLITAWCLNQWRLPWRKRPAAVSNIHTVKWWFRGPQRRTFNVSAPLTFTPHQTSQHAVMSHAQLSPRRETEFPSNVKPSVTSHFLNCTMRFSFLNLSNVHQGMCLCKPFLLHKFRLRGSATSTKGPFRRA